MIEKSMYLKRIGKNIATCREKKGYSQEELSRKCGYTSENSRSTIQKIESGKSDIPASKLCALAQALGVSVLELLKCSDDINIGGNNTNSAVGLGNTVTNLNDNSTTYNIQNLSEQEQELLRIYRDITPKGQIALMNTAYDIEKQYQKKRGISFNISKKAAIFILFGMLLLGTIQLYLLFAECSSNHSAIEHKQEEFVPERTIEKQNTVYITDTGAKYHRADCYTIKGGGVPVSKEEAEELGKEPCKVCRP